MAAHGLWAWIGRLFNARALAEARAQAERAEARLRDAIDAVLMDLRMPVTDGLAAIRAIRSEERAQGRQRTPTIVLSANTSPHDRAASAAAGADGHIAKPIRVEALFGALHAALSAKAA